MATFPARLHVLLASESPVGVVIRRGPSKSVATFSWQRERDEFALGQWLRGRIYERRCDLSPDGKHFIYFAFNGRSQEESQGSWTAVSRAPYLKALAMFPKGDCWNGGGLWTSSNRYWLNDGYGHSVLHDTDEVQRDRDYAPTENWGGECLGIYYPRLLRDGWQVVEHTDKYSVFDKPLAHGWQLRKLAHAQIDSPAGKGCYWDEHQLIHPASQTCVSHPDWEWAEWDRHRLVWTTGGKLFGGILQAEGLTDQLELSDFNAWEFERIKAPY